LGCFLAASYQAGIQILPDKSRFIKDNEPFNVDFLNKPSKAAVCDVPLCDVLDRRVGK
jgi:hypothetical protein